MAASSLLVLLVSLLSASLMDASFMSASLMDASFMSASLMDASLVFSVALFKDTTTLA